MLPDGRHFYDSFMYGDWVRVTVVDTFSRETRVSHTVRLRADGSHEEMLLLSQELANKRFGKQKWDRHLGRTE